MNPFVKDKIRITCKKLEELSAGTILEVPEMQYIPWGYKKPGEQPVPDETWKPFYRFDRVQGKDRHFWFYVKLRTPTVLPDQSLALEIKTGHENEWDATNPQGLLYLNGKIAQGLDINHREALLEADKEYEILIYFYTGMTESPVEVVMNLKQIDLPVRKLYYDMKVPYDAALCFGEEEYTHIRTIMHLEQACNLLDFRAPGSREFRESIAAADRYMQEEYYRKECGNCDAVISYVGHTHIDVAWLWTLAQTREKTQRSFATVLRLMEQYPDYIFMSSQPQLYEYLKQEAPELYQKVKDRIKEGRWEAEGAMWLEADCNLTSGESLVRQIFHGKRFMQEEFGVTSHILWLPDVFGYSAALPQILKKAGVDQFVTSKISWNESNQIPYDSFLWQGIDGTEVFTYFLTAQFHKDYLAGKNYTTYVGTVSPEMNLGTWERYQQKEYNHETIVTFGYGDGGGGPTAEMLEAEKRLEYGLPGMPKAQMSRAGDFLARVQKRFEENCTKTGRTPRWVGELYLEFHRGTYTSIAKNKKNNRQCEFLCQETEMLAMIGELLCGRPYPTATLYANWQVLLLNQFHDIIPGSSIREVYEESDRQYDKVRKEIGAIRKERLSDLAENTGEAGLLVCNPNSFPVSGYVKTNGEPLFVRDIPALGYRVVHGDEIAENDFAEGNAGFTDGIRVSEQELESPYYLIRFDGYMNICSLYDKENTREVITGGKCGNQLRVFEDFPREYDNWEISDYYKQKMWIISDVQSANPVRGNGYGGFEIVRRYMSSTVVQRILIYGHSRRIDFETKIDWHEHHVLLKAAFPTTIHTNKATYEIQFGNLERPTHRNTSWDAARFEVCAQKWGDLSEEGYGVSLLNDCKYGYSAEGNELCLTLLKCGAYPNEEADQGEHTFTYSLYPHKDSYKQGGTIREAYLLNRPLICMQAGGGGKLPAQYSLVSCDMENIIIETVKKAEDGNGMIVRLYDAWGRKSNPTLKFGFAARKISLCDLMEQPLSEIGAGNEVTLRVNNYEIVSMLVEM